MNYLTPTLNLRKMSAACVAQVERVISQNSFQFLNFVNSRRFIEIRKNDLLEFRRTLRVN